MAFGFGAWIRDALVRRGLKISRKVSWTGHKEMARFFSDKEIAGLEDYTVRMLDCAREFAGVPFHLTSSTGGKHVANSAHYTGEAVDVAHGGDPVRAARIAYGLGRAGFIRVGFYDRHIHADTSPTLPQTQWDGKSQ